MNKKWFNIFLFVLAIIIVAGVTAFVTTQIVLKKVGETNVSEVKTSGSIAAEDSSKLIYNVPEGMYDITSVYVDTLSSSLGLGSKLSCPNTVILGNAESLTESTTSIMAAPFSDVYSLCSQIYGDDFTSKGKEEVYTPAYILASTGKLPDDLDEDYKVTDLKKTVVSGGLTFYCYEVTDVEDYTVYVDENGNKIPEDEVEPAIVTTQFLAAYSLNEDPVEIIVYHKDNNVDEEYKLLKNFLGVID